MRPRPPPGPPRLALDEARRPEVPVQPLDENGGHEQDSKREAGHPGDFPQRELRSKEQRESSQTRDPRSPAVMKPSAAEPGAQTDSDVWW